MKLHLLLAFALLFLRGIFSSRRKKRGKKSLLKTRQLKYVIYKAMKSSPLLGPFGDSEFWGFSLLKIKTGWVL